MQMERTSLGPFVEGKGEGGGAEREGQNPHSLLSELSSNLHQENTVQREQCMEMEHHKAKIN